MPKYINETILSGNDGNTGTFKLDNLDKINNAMDKGMAILDKIIGMKKYKEAQIQQISSPAQTINTKAEKMITNAPQPKILIDDDKAISTLKELIKNIPADTQEKSLKDTIEELNKPEVEAFLKPQVNSFIRGCVRLE